MVLILDGNLEIDAHVWRDLGYLICLRHFIRSRSVTSKNCFFSRKDIFSFLRKHHFLSNHLIYEPYSTKLLPFTIMNGTFSCFKSSTYQWVLCTALITEIRVRVNFDRDPIRSPRRKIGSGSYSSEIKNKVLNLFFYLKLFEIV